MIQIFKNLKKRKCDACSITYDKNFLISFGHNPNRQEIATFCEGCLSDLKEQLESVEELKTDYNYFNNKRA